MHLATLTCDRDIRQLVIQAESIANFVSPCVHWIVVNQQNITESHKQRYYDLLSPFYKNHKLEIIFPEDLKVKKITYDEIYGNTYFNGWKYQFIIANLIRDDYMCLTPKNFFIKPVNLEEYRSVIGNGTITPNFDMLSPGLKEISEFLRQPIPQFVFSSQPPFVINYEILKTRLGDMKDFDKFWDDVCLKIYNKELAGILDWHFYSFLMHDKFHYKITDRAFNFFIFSRYYPEFTKNPIKYLDDLDNSSKIVTLALHRNFILSCSQHELKILNEWLSQKGITTKLKWLKWNYTYNMKL
jgi:hypothetical protein